jgi:hypothetical protein
MQVADHTSECSPNNHNDISQDKGPEIGSIQLTSFVQVKKSLFMYSILYISTLSGVEKKRKLMAVGIRCADHATPSIH